MILESDDLRALINPEVIALLQGSPNPEFHVNDLLEGVKAFGKFDATTDRILIRPGLLDFVTLADQFGRAASFFAGYEPADLRQMERYLEACALPGRGQGGAGGRG